MMRLDDDGAEVTDCSFVLAGVQRDLGAEIGAVDDAGVILGAAHVARVLEGDPWVAGLEEHLEDRFPDVDGGNVTVKISPFLASSSYSS